MQIKTDTTNTLNVSFQSSLRHVKISLSRETIILLVITRDTTRECIMKTVASTCNYIHSWNKVQSSNTITAELFRQVQPQNVQKSANIY